MARELTLSAVGRGDELWEEAGLLVRLSSE